MVLGLNHYINADKENIDPNYTFHQAKPKVAASPSKTLNCAN